MMKYALCGNEEVKRCVGKDKDGNEVEYLPVVHGRWDRSGYCSECDFWTCYCGDYNYCPHCGTKMNLGVE